MRSRPPRPASGSSRSTAGVSSTTPTTTTTPPSCTATRRRRPDRWPGPLQEKEGSMLAVELSVDIPIGPHFGYRNAFVELREQPGAHVAVTFEDGTHRFSSDAFA